MSASLLAAPAQVAAPHSGLRRSPVIRSTRSKVCKSASSPGPTAFSPPAARPSPRSSRRRSKSSTPMLHRLPAAVPRLALQSLLLAATAAAAAVFAGAGAAGAAFAAGNGSEPGSPRNVYGGELGLCSTSPMTGYFRDGRCDTGPMDYGTHTVCAKVTNEFLQYTLQQGNDLITPRPEYRFPGLKEGEGWCLCAARWREALAAGVAPPVVLEATHSKTLQFVVLSELENHAAGAGSSGSTATQ